ncbi:hypothetical protein SHELI_v1c10160 [Spiroplasma helicoides]|uniref:Lipoprotein n=1 Tax=Spiroplasma helicoides TaxID=216938 RepID=A0A1B3SM12_9MOLU|nr:hypothetical protein [Spiroplasma helicoides]AOG60963.1 hypothetical protein SHELI_v1c10160 [Spiroplasma helicoides]
MKKLFNVLGMTSLSLSFISTTQACNLNKSEKTVDLSSISDENLILNPLANNKTSYENAAVETIKTLFSVELLPEIDFTDTCKLASKNEDGLITLTASRNSSKAKGMAHFIVKYSFPEDNKLSLENIKNNKIESNSSDKETIFQKAKDLIKDYCPKAIENNDYELSNYKEAIESSDGSLHVSALKTSKLLMGETDFVISSTSKPFINKDISDLKGDELILKPKTISKFDALQEAAMVIQYYIKSDIEVLPQIDIALNIWDEKNNFKAATKDSDGYAVIIGIYTSDLLITGMATFILKYNDNDLSQKSDPFDAEPGYEEVSSLINEDTLEASEKKLTEYDAWLERKYKGVKRNVDYEYVFVRRLFWDKRWTYYYNLVAKDDSKYLYGGKIINILYKNKS